MEKEKYPVSNPTDFSVQFELLRLRFLALDSNFIREALWNEHPQVAIYILNWIGSPELFQFFLAPLPAEQQANLLYRQAYLRYILKWGRKGIFDRGKMGQKELFSMLLQYYKEIAPDIISAVPFDSVPVNSPPPIRGDELLKDYIIRLSEEDYDELHPFLDELDICLSRILYSIRIYRQSSNSRQKASISLRTHGFFNGFADYFNTKINRIVSGQLSIFTESIISVDAPSYWEELKSFPVCIRTLEKQTGSYFYFFFDVALKSLFFDIFFGANVVHPVVSQPVVLGSAIERSALLWIATQMNSYFVKSSKPVIDLEMDKPEIFHSLTELSARNPQTKPPILATILLEKESGGSGKLKVILESPLVEKIYDQLGEEELLFDIVKNIDNNKDIQEKNRAELEKNLQGLVELIFNNEKSISDPDDNENVNAFAEIKVEGVIWNFLLESLENQKAEIPEEEPMDILLKGSNLKKRLLTKKNSTQNKVIAKLHLKYGIAFFNKCLWKEAENAFKNALEDKSTTLTAQIYLAAIHGQMGHYFRELTAYKNILAQSPKLREVYILLARRLSFLNKPEESFQTMKIAIDLGFQQLSLLEEDSCFTALRCSPQWQRFLSEHVE